VLRARKAFGAKVSLEPSELLVNAAVADGITSIASVHDSCGCLPAHAEQFRRIIREQFVALYKEYDVLNEVLGEAHRDLKDPKGLAFA
jgi:DNA-directed RNA polymerase